MRVPAVAVAVAILAAGCGATSDRSGEAARGDGVYQIGVAVDTPPECEEEPSCAIVKHVAWVAPESGAWRTETEDGTGLTTTKVSVEGMYLVAHSSPPARSVRIGSPSYLGPPGDLPADYETLLAEEDLAVGDSVELERDGVSYTLTLEDVIAPAEAERRGLFAISTAEPGTTVDRELSPGEPTTLPVEAYWFGPQVAGREAFASFDHEGDEIVHIIFYGDPEEIAAGKTHAYSSTEVPEREVQVGSQPVGDRNAQKTLRAFDGRNGDLVFPPRARTKIRLQNGEEATLFPKVGEGESFAVVTQRALVSVSGILGAEARRLAPLLRPL
jgi:hypothetical protein